MADKKISQLTGATTPLAGTEVLPIVQGGSTVKVSVDNLTTGKNVKASSVSVNTTSTAAKVTVNGDVQAQGGFTALTGSLGVAIGAAGAAITSNDVCVIAGEAYSNYKDLLISPRKNGGDVGNTVFLSGDVKSSVGNFVVGTAAKGIDFSANTGAAGETSSLLNWYEEGTWTPSLSRINASGFSYTPGTNDKGYYTRIGNIVHVFGSFDGTFSGGSDLYRITQLPFNQKTGISYVGSVGHIINISAGADVGPLAAVGSNVSVAEIYTGNPTSGNIHTFSLTYFV